MAHKHVILCRKILENWTRGINYLQGERLRDFWATSEVVSPGLTALAMRNVIGGSIGAELTRVNHLRGMRLLPEKRAPPDDKTRSRSSVNQNETRGDAAPAGKRKKIALRACADNRLTMRYAHYLFAEVDLRH